MVFIMPENLSPKRQKDFYDTLQYQLVKPIDWGIAALQIKPIETWEKYGFAALVLYRDARERANRFYNAHKEEIWEVLRKGKDSENAIN